MCIYGAIDNPALPLFDISHRVATSLEEEEPATLPANIPFALQRVVKISTNYVPHLSLT